MKFYCEVSTSLQIALLVLSQLALICLSSSALITFIRKGSRIKWLTLTLALAVNIGLFFVMQLASRLTGQEELLHLHIPYGLLMLVTSASLACSVIALLTETGRRKTITHASIKESFDNLPTGVCFFNADGLPVLCNLAMHRFSFSVCGKDVQFVSDLQGCLAPAPALAPGVQCKNAVFMLPDATAWKLESRIFIHEDGEQYTQFLALDVTDLYKTSVELSRENDQLRRAQEQLQQLSANVVKATREEEILNTKMRVHDEMGKSLLAAQKYLREGNGEVIPDWVVASWQRAVHMLKYNNEEPEEDMLSQILQTCEFVGIDLIRQGQMPKNENAAYLLTCAIRESVTNAVRHAEATKLFATFTQTQTMWQVELTNDGKAPAQPVSEGGGLSNLRRRIERSGGRMQVQSLPRFRLLVSIPKEKGEML